MRNIFLTLIFVLVLGADYRSSLTTVVKPLPPATIRIQTRTPQPTQIPTITPIPSPTSTPVVTASEKFILVVLSEQTVYAYKDDVLIQQFLISSGLPSHPTVTGDFHVEFKLDSTRMTGEGYDLSDVPWVMYFYQGYGFHGTYWHHNFGTPMSHGCLNMRTEDAKWLYDWTPLGTLVRIIP